MNQQEEDFLKRLMATFKLEAQEHLNTMTMLLHNLEGPEGAGEFASLSENLFREAHSLKGAARSVDLLEVEGVCHALESVLAKMKRGEVSPGAYFFEVFYRAIDHLTHGIDAAPGTAKTASPMALIDAIRTLELPVVMVASPQMESTAATPAPEPSSVPKPESKVPISARDDSRTVRISTAKLEALLIQAEELHAFKFNASHMVRELRDIHRTFEDWRKQERKAAHEGNALRRELSRQNAANAESRKNAALLRILDNIARNEEFGKALSSRIRTLERQTEMERRVLGGMLDCLMEEVKEVLMLPFSTLSELFPKVVRDLARDCGKEADLQLKGTSIEIDRRILEQMKAPLLHLIRNAVDHGIESPSARSARNKPAKGKISLEVALRDGNKVELTISDDGAGVEAEVVKKNAVEAGILSWDAASRLGEADALALIFESGLSTSEILTDVSGRGMGLAIVSEKVEKLGGSVNVQAGTDGGTCFRILLPATLATFRGLLVVAGGRRYVLPAISVERVTRVSRGAIIAIEGRNTIELEGTIVPMVLLSDVLKLECGNGQIPATYQKVVVLSGAGKRVAFSVDDVIGDQEVLVKKLGPQLIRVPHVAAATVLDGGKLVPILNVPDLLKSAGRLSPPMMELQEGVRDDAQWILVVEDSITSRALLKNVLESRGYRVAVAVDGLNALNALHAAHFDLVVSDVEMPNMDGFALTAKIRSEKVLADIPVILVTSLASREHKEQGIAAGANAYIEKGGFDSANLLDTIHRLI